MDYYDDPTNIEAYISMAEGYDGRELIAELQHHLPAGATVLELGMGPGKDLLLLSERYRATGTDASALFVERFRSDHPAADVFVLDALTLDTPRTFDAIYSNKVLHHLTRAELEASLQLQAEHLNPGGVLLHSFWYGDHEEVMHGMRFQYYTEATLRAVVGSAVTVVALRRYAEMETDDSLMVVLKKTDPGLL